MLPHDSAQVQYKLAKVWRERGRLERAIAGFQQALALEAGHLEAHVALIELLLEHGRLSEATDSARRALESFPNEARFHKNFVEALARQGRLEEAFRHYELTRRDSKPLDIQPPDILCCTVVRNESVRLPYFLSYYRQKGITKFLMIDNNSTDETPSYLLAQPEVYVWHSPHSFNRANFGAGWFELLLRTYGIDHWCLIVDADEIFYYPACENKSLVQLCRELDEQQKRAFNAVLLDMYSDKAIKDTHYQSGQSFLEVCHYFDRKFFHRKVEHGGPYHNQTVYFGGARQRVFGDGDSYYLSKVPLLKYDASFILAGGQHWTNRPLEEIAAPSGCLLHFKYFSSFPRYVQAEVERKEHFGNAMQYAEYEKGLAHEANLSLYDKEHSIKLQDSRQLARLGIMHEEETSLEIKFPAIAPLPDHLPRPLWSVMITVYDRINHLARALQSVIAQAVSPDEMQIEVITDCPPEAIQQELANIVRNVGGGRAHFYCSPHHLGHPHIFNLCIERARGKWIHILHDDDWVEPGFYRALQNGIVQEPQIGTAFCRHLVISKYAPPRRLSPLERESPGIIPNWLSRIVAGSRVQFSAMAVKREAYEKLGGFCPHANSAFDWEMWIRLAQHYAAWFEPEPLAYFCQDGETETQRLMKSGAQIADARRVIEIVRTYQPAAMTEKLSLVARESIADYALDLVGQQLQRGECEAAFANIREAFKCSQSEPIKRKLLALLFSEERNKPLDPVPGFQAHETFTLKGDSLGKINLENQKTFACHRSGWNYALMALAPLHNGRGILFDGFIERNFAWEHRQEGKRPSLLLETMKRQGLFERLATSEEKGITPYTQPWVGFIHNPQGMPKWFHYQESPQTIFAKEIWKESLKSCLGLFTFSEYHAVWLRQQIGKPVSVLFHPTEFPEVQFDFDRYLANPDKKIIQIGWWLRKLSAIYQLPLAKNNRLRYEKIRLVPRFSAGADAYLKELMQKEREYENLTVDPDDAANTREILHLPNEEYDEWLSQNLAFAYLYDANTNNVVIECMARATPLLINPLPAVVEYLGEDYPLYFTDLREAAEKVLDTSLIMAAHRYLKTCETRAKLKAEYFLKSFKQSEVYRSI